MLKKWADLPETFKNDAVRPYYDCLDKKRGSIFVKRIGDIVLSLLMIVILSPVLLIVALVIKHEDPGPVFFRQVRVTTYAREFRIFKFRTMVVNAESLGTQVTSQNDPRVTKVGAWLRKYRVDEFPQLFNVLCGDMSFVGTRPEVPRYVRAYSDEMMATLLMPAGVTSEASIKYKDENELLGSAGDPDSTYIKEVLPAKMRFNLESLRDFGIGHELGLMFRTVGAVFGGEKED